MASVGVAPTSGLRESCGVDRLPEEMNDMKIRDDKEMEATVVDGNGTEIGHIIVTTMGGGNGQPKQIFVQDMSPSTPTLESIIKDLHGYEWRFKHIFRGQPRRQLFTTGWSSLMTSKRFVVGDNVFEDKPIHCKHEQVFGGYQPKM